MSLTAWIIAYSFDLVFWLWVIYWGGADWMQGRLGFFRLGLLNAKSIRWLGWIFLIWTTIWFIIGLITPDARFEYLLHP